MAVMGGTIPEYEDLPRQRSLLNLEKGNINRLARARMKERFRAGEELLSTVLADPPDYIQKMMVFELINSYPYMSADRTQEFLNRHRIGLYRQVRDLTERQLRRLAFDLKKLNK